MDLISTGELARRTGSSTSFWRKLRYRGLGPRVMRIGRLRRYDWRDVTAWLDENSIQPGDAA